MKKSILLIALLLGIVSSAKADDTTKDGITIATYGNVTGNTTRTMTLAVTHETNNYVAFQMDLTLPEGTTIDPTAIVAKTPMQNATAPTISGTTDTNTNFKFDGNTIATNDDNTTTYRVIGYNLNNNPLAGTSGDICLTIPLATESGVAYDVSTVKASNIIFVESTNLTGVDMTAAETDSRLWGDVNVDKKVNATDIDAAITATASGSTEHGLDHFATNTGIEGAFKATDINNVINYAK